MKTKYKSLILLTLTIGYTYIYIHIHTFGTLFKGIKHMAFLCHGVAGQLREKEREKKSKTRHGLWRQSMAMMDKKIIKRYKTLMQGMACVDLWNHWASKRARQGFPPSLFRPLPDFWERKECSSILERKKQGKPRKKGEDQREKQGTWSQARFFWCSCKKLR